MTGSVADAVSAVDRSGERFTSLLRSGLDAERRIKASTWTVSDLGRHIASGVEAYAQVADGDSSPYTNFDDRATTNQARLEAMAQLDLQTLADIIDAGRRRAVAALRQQPDDAVIAWHGGIAMPVRAVLGAMVGEFLFHGLDLARTFGVRWQIDRVDALPVIDVFTAVTPHLLVGEAVRDISATFEIRFRGYDTSTFAFHDGALTVTSGPASRADVRMSVDPAAFLAIGYKRAGLAKSIATGGAVAWGRRPWLAFRFAGFFQDP